MSLEVWLATPVEGQPLTLQESAELDPYSCRVGGTASWLRPPTLATLGTAKKKDKNAANSSEGKAMRCGKCSAAMMCLTQFSAPLDEFDRVLYVFCCAACSRAAKRVVVQVLRCQTHNPEYVSEEAGAKKEEAKPLFEETDDWGDEGSDDDAPLGGAGAAASDATAGSTQELSAELKEKRKSVKLCTDILPAAPAPSCPCRYLELFAEPKSVAAEIEATKGEGSLEDQIAAVEQKFPGAVDMGEVEQDEGDHDEDHKEYSRRLEFYPSQVLRWGPGTAPLFSAPSRPGVPPPCERCGSARRFEFQLTSPLIYYLTKDIKGLKEDDNFIQFSTVLVYTCAGNCYPSDEDPAGPYCAEFAFVQNEEVKDQPLLGGKATEEDDD